MKYLNYKFCEEVCIFFFFLVQLGSLFVSEKQERLRRPLHHESLVMRHQTMAFPELLSPAPTHMYTRTHRHSHTCTHGHKIYSFSLST